MPLILNFQFHLFIGTTSKRPTEPRPFLSRDQDTSKRRTEYRHPSTKAANTAHSDRDLRQENTRHNARERHGNGNPYDPYGRQCETAFNHEVARRKDRESLEILLHYFPPQPTKLGNAATSTGSAATSLSFADSFPVSSTPRSQVVGLNRNSFDWGPSSSHSQANESNASSSGNDDSDVSNRSVPQRFPFQGQISGLLLRSVPDVLPPDPVYETDDDDDKEERDVNGGGVASRAGDALVGEVEVKQEDRTQLLQELSEQLRRRDLEEGDVDVPDDVGAISPAEKGLDGGYAVSDGASERVSKRSAPSVTAGLAESDKYIMSPSPDLLDPDDDDSEQQPTACGEIETSSLDDEDGSLHLISLAHEPDSTGTSNHFTDSAPTPDVAQAAITADEDGHLTKPIPGTRKPHYALPTTSFRMRNRPSSPSSAATPSSANNVANRAASLLHTAKSITQDLKTNSRPSSRLSSSNQALVRNWTPTIPSIHSRIPVATRNATNRTPSTTSRTPTEASASRSTSFHTAATSASSPSHVPGLSASLTPIIIRGGGGGKKVGSRSSPQVSAGLPDDADQTSGVKLHRSSNQSASQGGDAVGSAQEGWSPTSSPPAAVVLAAGPSSDNDDDAFISASSMAFGDLGEEDDDADASSSEEDEAEPISSSSSGPGSDQCIHFDLCEPQDIKHGKSEYPQQSQDTGIQVPSSGVIALPVEQDGRTNELEIVEGDEEWVKVSAGEEGGQGDTTGPFDVMSPAPKVWGQRSMFW